MKRLLVFAAATLTLSASALAAQDKPNILVIWGDDIGQSNISAYTHGPRWDTEPEHRPDCQ